MLQAQHSNGSTTWGPYGTSRLNASRSERPSPSSPQLLLSHLSGDATNQAHIIRFHWRPQWGGGSALLWFCNSISTRNFLVIQSKRFQMIWINFDMSREVIAPFNGKPRVLMQFLKIEKTWLQKHAWFLHSMLSSSCRLIPLKIRGGRVVCLCRSDTELISYVFCKSQPFFKGEVNISKAKQSGTFFQSLVSYINYKYLRTNISQLCFTYIEK